MEEEQPEPIGLARHTQYIYIGERITRAIRIFFNAFATGLISLVLAPILAIRIFFTTEEEVLVAIPFGAQEQSQLNINLQAPTPDEDETWMKEHKEQYEDD